MDDRQKETRSVAGWKNVKTWGILLLNSYHFPASSSSEGTTQAGLFRLSRSS